MISGIKRTHQVEIEGIGLFVMKLLTIKDRIEVSKRMEELSLKYGIEPKNIENIDFTKVSFKDYPYILIYSLSVLEKAIVEKPDGINIEELPEGVIATLFAEYMAFEGFFRKREVSAQ